MTAATPFPQAIEAERALLGGLIEDPDKFDAIGRLEPSQFYRRDHSNLYALLRSMRDRGEDIDSITVPERIGRAGHGERFGGLAYVVQHGDHVPSTANLETYARIVREFDQRRRAMALRSRFDELADPGVDLAQHIAELTAGLEAVTASGGGRSHWKALGDSAESALSEVYERGDGAALGLPTSLHALDEYIGGLIGGKLYVLAARPAMGKTALAVNITTSGAKTGAGVGIFSLEMMATELAERVIVAESGVSGSLVRTGSLSEEMYAALGDATDATKALKVYVDDRSGLAWPDVVAGALQLQRDMAREGDELGLIVIDYLTLLDVQVSRGDTRSSAVGKISTGAKNLAKALGAPVLLLSQLSRRVDERADKRPMLSDLRDSGSIEQDADVVMFIYRDEVYKPDTADKGIAEIIVAKNRGGQTGTAKVRFEGHRMRFSDLGADPIDAIRPRRADEH